MVILFLISLVIISIVGIGLYLLQRSAAPKAEPVLPPPPDLRGLFAEDPLTTMSNNNSPVLSDEERAALVSRARSGERSVLAEVSATGDARLYDELLEELVRVADSDAKLLALMSYVGTQALRVNTALASAILSSWRKSPDRSRTSKALHFAALSDDAKLYNEAVEETLEFWRAGKLTDVSAIELRALFDGEFWVLSSRTRSSGAGFVLKRTLDSARRELEAASVNQ